MTFILKDVWFGGGDVGPGFLPYVLGLYIGCENVLWGGGLA
jgi:hypothetical protein